MAKSFNNMTSNLKNTVSGINTIIMSLLNYAESMTRDTMELSSGAREQDATTKQVTDSVGEMAHSIADVAKNAQEAATASQRASKIADEGQEYITDTVSGMKQISETMDNMTLTMQNLSDSSIKVGDIVEIINDISGQTNLLALNASIEAARAGEHGRGFAIVADEVRKLAERSAESTSKITEMIMNIQKETKISEQNILEGKEQVDKGMHLVERSNKSMRNIVEASKNCLNMIDQIAAASDQQSCTADELSSSMEGIAMHAKSTMDASDHIEATSRDLKHVANNLNELAVWFKTEEQDDTSDQEVRKDNDRKALNTQTSVRGPSLSA
jgi:methyl-accepting chemotaxis protein